MVIAMLLIMLANFVICVAVYTVSYVYVLFMLGILLQSMSVGFLVEHLRLQYITAIMIFFGIMN